MYMAHFLYQAGSQFSSTSCMVLLLRLVDFNAFLGIILFGVYLEMLSVSYLL